MKVLLVEDEPDLRTIVSSYLLKEGFICEVAETYLKALRKISFYPYDIILLDITLPDGNGMDLLKIIKGDNLKAGIIIISAKNSLDDKISGLDIGADDYITKPFQLSELNARIKAVLRRHQFNGSDKVQFNEISIDINGKIIRINNEPIESTRKEFDLLLFFILNKNRVLTKETIAEHLWGDNFDLADNFDFIYTHLN
ncbi:MAG TPA: response regulator transcription factor, partial [Chitinophagales bacterium]|nr:response regulator transcription factor [Chitinophagales bacterium]